MNTNIQSSQNYYQIPSEILNNVYLLNLLSIFIVFIFSIFFIKNYEIRKKKLNKQIQLLNITKDEVIVIPPVIETKDEDIIPKINIIKEEEKEEEEEFVVPEPITPRSLNQAIHNIKILRIQNKPINKYNQEAVVPNLSCCSTSVCASSILSEVNESKNNYINPSSPSSASSTPNFYSPHFVPLPPILEINESNNLPLISETIQNNIEINENDIIKIERSEFNNKNGFISGNNVLFTDFNGSLLNEGPNGKFIRIIPEGINEVFFDYKFNYPIQPYSFPISVKTIIFGNFFNKTIEKNSLPQHLTKLYFGDSFTNGGSDFSKGVIPNTVIELGFGHCFNRLLDENTVPLSVKKLKLGCYIQYTKRDEYRRLNGSPILKSVGTIPSHIEYLSMGNCFNQKLLNIPNNINLIFVKSNYQYFDEDKRFFEKKSDQKCSYM